MIVWESGRESSLLDEIIAGRKTIESRLNRGKFAEYKPGDRVWLRRDYRDEAGILHEGESRQVLVGVIAVRQYSSFVDLAKREGYKRVIPSAESAEQAAQEYDAFYSAEDQAEYGVLAIEFKVLSHA